MTPDILQKGKPYPGSLPDEDVAVFEFSKEGPELRLFFSGIPDDVADRVEQEECWLGLLREGDIAIVPWRIGELMSGDAQFHVFLYPPETRPTPDIMAKDDRYAVQLLLVDRQTGVVKTKRSVVLSTLLSREFAEAIAYQLGNHIGREEYDAQVSQFQRRYPDVQEVIRAAPRFEKTEALT